MLCFVRPLTSGDLGVTVCTFMTSSVTCWRINGGTFYVTKMKCSACYLYSVVFLLLTRFNPLLIALYFLAIPTHWRGRGPGAMVNKTACMESRRPRVRTTLWSSSFIKTKYYFPTHSERFNIVGSLCDRKVACPASISNIVSGGQCHLIYLTTLRSFT